MSEINYEELVNKYEPSVIKNIDMNNLKKIITFLISEGFDYINEIVENYLDLFLIDYDEFIDKYSRLKNEKKDLVNAISKDLGILEYFFES